MSARARHAAGGRTPRVNRAATLAQDYPWCMCVGCAMCAASAATGFRTWLQTHHFGWLTPRRMRALTIARDVRRRPRLDDRLQRLTVAPAHASQAATPAHHAVSQAP